MPKRSNLFLNTFSTIVAGVVLFSAAIYFFSVPLIRSTVTELEERSGRAVLNDVYELLKSSYTEIVAWRDLHIEAHRSELRNVIQLVTGYISQVEAEMDKGKLSAEEAKRKILEDVRHFKYGHNDYIWIADYSSRLISHPDPEINGTDFSRIKDINDNLIVSPMVDGARAQGEGFHTYWWQRLGNKEPAKKFSYYKNLPEWQWVIGTGVYIDDVDQKVAVRKAEVTDRLRRHLHLTRIAKTGYLYVFDSAMNMIIHPNQNIEHTNFRALLDPVTQKSIGEELIAAANTPEAKLLYKWDKPTDPGNYIYDKISWVRYLPEFDWYIASSVYIDELHQTADTLTKRILLVAGLALIFSIISAYVFLRRLLQPISRLASAASKVGEGDLSAKIDIRSNDEIGVLTDAFNAMVDRLKDQIENLESRVADRTKELEELSVTDNLTGLFNRRKLDERLGREVKRAERFESDLAVIMIDMDHFKAVNDEYGHQVGDQVLQHLAKILQAGVRETDTLGRWGGEEFLVISPGNDQEGATFLAEKLRRIVAAYEFPSVGQKTCSLGVALWRSGEGENGLIAKADAALYRAKAQGRNCIVVAEDWT